MIGYLIDKSGGTYSMCSICHVWPYFGGPSNTNDQIQQIQQIAATWTIETQILVEIQGQADWTNYPD